ncbi:MAG: acyl-CoA thioesterase [Muribaculaceae bacterium]
MQYIFDLNMKVRDYEVDSEGIVNNAIYLHYMEHTRHEFCEWAGLSFRQMHASGIDPVISRSEVRYIRPLSLGEHFVSKIAITRRGPLFVFVQDIFTPEGEPIAKGIIEVACIEHGRLTRGDVLAKAFERYFTDHDA